MRRVISWLRALVRRGALEREMREEMKEHLERAAERLMRRGLSADDARAMAAREFGNVALLQEEGRDARGTQWVESIPDARRGHGSVAAADDDARGTGATGAG